MDNPKELGSPITLYLFQNSIIAKLSPRLSLDYEWNFGTSLVWKRYDKEHNSYNIAVGSKMNAYLKLGFIQNWQMAPQWSMRIGIDMTHFSNGNTKFPNSGVNIFGARIRVVRTFGNEKNNSPSASLQKVYGNPTEGSVMIYDLILFGATRKRAMINNETHHMIPGSFGIIGLNFNPMYRLNRYFMTVASLDLQYDESANLSSHFAGGSSENPRFSDLHLGSSSLLVYLYVES